MLGCRKLGMTACLAAIAALALPAGEKDPYEPKLVTLAELVKEIKSYQGKVVVMDAWNDG